MPKCAVCDGDSFDLQDGLFYCSNCQTQSQDLLEEEAEDDAVSGYSSASSARHEIKTKKFKKSKDEIDLGRRWTTYDAYNLVLKKQVDALLALGASSELKSVVLNLWVIYLEKTGVICPCTPLLENKKRIWQVYPRERDVQVLLGESSKLSVISPVFKKTRRGISQKKKCKMHYNENTKGKNRPAVILSDEDTLLSEEESANDSVSSPSSDHSQSVLYSSGQLRRAISPVAIQMKKLPKSSFGQYIGRMKLSRTLSFVYLGLLLIRDQILLSDLIRWLWEDRIPLYNLMDIFPEDMKFQTWDNQTFRLLHSVTFEGLRRDTEHLARYLSISNFPTPPMQYVAARFSKELSLPGSVNELVLKLVLFLKSKPIWKKQRKVASLPDYEGKAVACIIVAVKLIAIKNDAAKCHLSDQECSVIETAHFVYDLWRKRISLRRELQLHFWQRALRHKASYRSIDFDALMSFYEEKAHKWKSRYCFKRLRHEERFGVEEICDMLCRPFNLLKGPTLGPKRTTSTPSSFPLQMEAGEALSRIVRCLDGHPSNGLVDLIEQQVFDCERVSNQNCLANLTFTKESSVKRQQCSWWYPLEMSKKNMPSCLNWLLELCADILEMKPESLRQHVVAIEKVLLLKTEKIQGRARQ